MAITFFVDNQAGFNAALTQHQSVGVEDFEASSLAANNIASFADPLAPGVANSVFASGTQTAVGVTVQSNTLGGNPTSVSPRGANAIATASAGYLGTPDDQVSTNDKADSFDIIVDPPGSAAVTAVSFIPLYFDQTGVNQTDVLTVRVYDAADNLLATQTFTGGDYQTEASFIGIVATGGDSIYRINIDDGTAVTDDFIGADDIEVFTANAPAVAVDDAFSTNEATAIGAGLNVFNANPTTADSDAESDSFSVIAVNGIGADVGTQIALASGALLTLNANGTFNYDPNGAFNSLAFPGSGGTNLTATDSFAYTVTGGDTASVTITVAGTDSNDTVIGSAGADTLEGGAFADTLRGLGGNDVLNGGAGSDQYFGGDGNDLYYVKAGDSVIEQLNEGTADKIISHITIAALAANVENLTLGLAVALDGTGNELGNLLYGNSAANTLSGLAGSDRLFGNGGADTLNGGADADQLWGGADADTFRFASLAENGSAASRDTIRDFAAATDKIDLTGLGFSSLVNGAFTGVAGQLRVATGTNTFVYGDVDGDRAADFYLALSGVVPLTLGDFIL